MRDGKIAEVEYQEPFDVLFRVEEFEYGNLVELTGLEPATPGLQSPIRPLRMLFRE